MRRIDRQRLRRMAVILFAVLIVAAVTMFLNVQLSETHGGTVELIDGQPNTSALAVPLAVFLVGAAGLMLALGWHPKRR